MKDKKIIYRKTMLKNIYNLSKLFDEVMDYETYKKCFINHLENDNKYYCYLKGLQNCYYYILLVNEELDNNLVLSVLYNLLTNENKNFDFNECFVENDLMSSIINVLKRIDLEDNNLKYVYSFVALNYVIYKFKKKLYRFSNSFFKKFYNKITTATYDSMLIEYINIELEKGITPDENYFDNLVEVTPNEIIKTLINNKEMIKETFKIKELYLYGSFSKDSYRIDSDIDVAVIFNEDMSYSEKYDLTYKFKQYILFTFKRYGDVMEYNETILKGEHYIQLF